jgi:sugar phosphate isomerase/epimerase
VVTAVEAHPRVSVSSFCSVRYTFEDDLALWQALGLDHVGLNIGKVEVAGWEAATAAVTDAGLRVSNLAGPAPAAADADEATQRAVVETLLRGVDFARDVGAPCLYLVSGGPGRCSWEEAATRFATAIAPVNEHARARGVALAIEPTNPLRADVSIVFSLRDTVRLAREADLDVVVELQACWLEPDFAATVRANVDRVRLVQVSDFAIGTFDTPNRAVPGDGDMPLERLLGTVLDAGYEGAFDLELLGPRIEAESYEIAIRRSVDYVSKILDRLGA